MPRLEFEPQWQATGAGSPEFRETSAFLTVRLDDKVVTKHEDVWSKTIRDSVLVSTYPLALWLAASWWRLNWQPLPPSATKKEPSPNADWRMTHEMGAVNHGYVWPHMVFASDNEMIRIWTTAPEPAHEQPARYLTTSFATLLLDEFRASVDDFIGLVLKRLDAVKLGNTDLAQLWNLVQADRQDKEASRYRRIEAALGFDPDESPEAMMHQALSLDQEMGGAALSELAPLYGQFSGEHSLCALSELRQSPGLVGTPAIPTFKGYPLKSTSEPAWQRAVSAARALRKEIGAAKGKIDDKTLLDLLGLKEYKDAGIQAKRHPGLGIPQPRGQIKFIPRKRHLVSRRFEQSRFIADIVQCQGAPHWLASTDLATSRQKFQRAFAAEFLCPIEELQEFLDDDFSEPSIEDAVEHFQVSQETVTSLLVNNGVISSAWPSDFFESRPPYPLAA